MVDGSNTSTFLRPITPSVNLKFVPDTENVSSAIALPSAPYHRSSLAEMQAHHETGKEFRKGGRCTRVTIDMLPDLALLEIFDHYIDDDRIDDWYPLVHVCQRWRDVVFASPCRLNLRLPCTPMTRMKQMLDTWPPLPIVVWFWDEEWDVDYMIEAFEHRDRICEMELFDVPCSQLERVLAGLQQPFPALRDLRFRRKDEMPTTPVVIPASFSAPRLQSLESDFIPFLGLPNLLISATHLVDLSLRRIPHTEYLSPEAIVNSLSVLTKLEGLTITFEFHQPHPGQASQCGPPKTRTLLPVLTSLTFGGFNEYLETIVARIDTPLLDKLEIIFFHQQIFHTPQLAHFISRTPKIRPHGEARVIFSSWTVSITLPSTFASGKWLRLSISFRGSDEQPSLLSVAQVWISSFPQAFIPAVERLYFLEREDRGSLLCREDEIEISQWLGILRLFIAVKGLYLSSRTMPRIGPALQELVWESVEVLPALETLFLEETFPSDPVQKSIGQLVSARQLSGHPITVSPWMWDFREAFFILD